MPQFIKEIPEIEDTVTRPVILEVVTKLLQTIRNELPYQIRFLNDADVLAVAGSTIDEDPNNVARLPADNYIMIDVDENYDENSNRTIVTGQHGQLPIFECHQTKTNMNPIYQQVIFQIKIKYVGGDKSRAESFRRRYRAMINNSVNGMAFKIPYFYFIPFEFMLILNNIYTLKEQVGGYGDTLGSWLRTSFITSIDAKASQAGRNNCLAVCEQAQNVLVLMDDNEDIAQKDRNNDSSSWTVEIPIKVYFDRPELMRISLPNLVHNQLIDNDYISKYRAYKVEQEQARMSTITKALTSFNPGGWIPKTQLPGVADPIFDDWLTGYDLEGYTPMVRILVALNDNDPHSLVNLTDLASWELSTACVNWLKRTKTKIGIDYGNVILAKLFVWDTMRNSELLSMDEDLNLSFQEELSVRNNHHVVLFVCDDPSLLNDDVWDDLANDPDFFEEYVHAIDPTISTTIKDGVLYDENGNPYVPSDVLTKVKDDIYTNYNTKGHHRQVMKTAMIYDIVAKRKDK